MEELEDRKRPQDDIPYEVRMKYIIMGYRRLEQKLEKLTAYAKKLERENEELQDQISMKGWKNLQMSEKNTLYRRENKALKKENEALNKKIVELESLLAGDLTTNDIEEKNIEINLDDVDMNF